MNKRKRDNYIAFHWKAISQWLNQCVACQQVGHKPELPERIGLGPLAYRLRKYYEPLGLDQQGLCEQCGASLAKGITKALVGLIGGIGSGKSLVAGFLSEFGAKVIEADKLGHEALRQPDTKEKVVERWGKGILNPAGEVDRRKLGKIVFALATEREALERIVFPFIERRIREEIDKANQDPAVKIVVLDAAILLEAGWGRFCDSVVFVDAPREERLKRLTLERGWSTEEVEAREKAQLPIETKKARADLILDNSGTPAQTRERVKQLFSSLRQRIKKDFTAENAENAEEEQERKRT